MRIARFVAAGIAIAVTAWAAPGVAGPPEGLSCKPSNTFQSEDPDDHFRLLYCSNIEPSLERSGRVDSYATARARSVLMNHMRSAGVDMKERWRAAYVHLCATELKNKSEDPLPIMPITCKWHADRLEFSRLFGQESWIGGKRKKRIRKTLREDAETIESVVGEEFSADEMPRAHEVYYDLRDEVWKEYARDQKKYAAYYRAVDRFRERVQAGNLDGCVPLLKEPLAKYVNAGDEKTQQAVVERFRDPVGYALTEALARCHWYHDRELLAGAHMRIIEDVSRKVTFGERLYYAQFVELRTDERKARKLPHLKGKKLLAMEPDRLAKPENPTASEAAREFRGKKELLGTSVKLGEAHVSRIEERKNGVTLYFAEKTVEVPKKKCRTTDRVERITRTGDVEYEYECRIVGHEKKTLKASPIELRGADGIEKGDWVQIVRSASGDKSTVFVAGEGREVDARVERVLGIDIR